MNKDQLLKKRYRAEKRFKFYGFVSITLAILFVIFLVNVIFSKGRTAFQRTTIAVEVNFNTEELELSSNASIEEIQDADFYDLSINSLLKLYKTEGAKQEKELLRVFSPDHDIEIKNFLIKNLDNLNKNVIVNLTTSDDIDQLHKGNYPRHLPEERRRISDFQLLIYDQLVKENKVNKVFNTEGIGIPKKYISRITERFFRVDPAKSKEVGGTGLGLAIVKHIVNQHRAEIDIKSEEGKGTEFILTFPNS